MTLVPIDQLSKPLALLIFSYLDRDSSARVACVRQCWRQWIDELYRARVEEECPFQATVQNSPCLTFFSYKNLLAGHLSQQQWPWSAEGALGFGPYIAYINSGLLMTREIRFDRGSLAPLCPRRACLKPEELGMERVCAVRAACLTPFVEGKAGAVLIAGVSREHLTVVDRLALATIDGEEVRCFAAPPFFQQWRTLKGCTSAMGLHDGQFRIGFRRVIPDPNRPQTRKLSIHTLHDVTGRETIEIRGEDGDWINRNGQLLIYNSARNFFRSPSDCQYPASAYLSGRPKECVARPPLDVANLETKPAITPIPNFPSATLWRGAAQICPIKQRLMDNPPPWLGLVVHKRMQVLALWRLECRLRAVWRHPDIGWLVLASDGRNHRIYASLPFTELTGDPDLMVVRPIGQAPPQKGACIVS